MPGGFLKEGSFVKILMVTPFYYPAVKYGGPVFCQSALDRQLAAKGVQVDVLTTVGGLPDPSRYTLGVWTEEDGVRVKRYRYFGYEHYTFSPGILAALMAEGGNYDLIHVSSVWNFPTVAAALAAAVHRVPYVVTPHGTLYRETISLKSRRLKLAYFHLVSRLCLERAAAVHFTTEDERANVTSYLGLRATPLLVPNGVDLAPFRSLPERGSFVTRHPELQGKRYILFFGRITKKKGLDILVRAFAALCRSRDDLSLVIAGPDSEGYGAAVRALVEEEGVGERTVFTGMLSGEERLSVLVDCEAFVLSSYSENFGMSVVEAMACGAPVLISNRVGVYREAEAHRAALVTEPTAAAVHAGLATLVGDAEVRRRLARNGRRMVEELYDIDKVADAMIGGYLSIIDRAPATAGVAS